MEVVPTSSLPLLAPPSGDTLKFRKRNNELDEIEEEALRVQIRQHIGAAVYTTKAARGDRRRYRRVNSEAAPPSAEDLDEGFPGMPDSSWMSVSKAFKLIKRLLWFHDEDMAEEIDDNDPKIIAGKKFLAGVEAFSILTDNELAHLVCVSELRTYNIGDIVLEDERRADGLYIVMTGNAGRFASTDGRLDEASPSETIGYQEPFGVIISPTEASSERPEATIVATSDTLECIWLPEVVIRMLTIQSRMEYEFVVILHNTRAQSEQLAKAQEEVLLNILRAGLHVTVMANTRNTTNTIVLLLSAPLWLLAREDKLMAMERIIENHAEEDSRSLGDDYEYHAETMTASDRIAAFASILTRSTTDKPPGAGIRGIEDNQDPVIRDIFPLQDPSMTDFIMSSWFRESHSVATKRLLLLRIKDYFGLRIAFLIAFVRLYNAALVYPLNVGVLLWVFWRWIHYRSYVSALGIYGLCVAFIWAPSFLKRWFRYQNSLLVEWNLLGTKEVAAPNPEFRDYVVETINVSSEGEPPDFVEVKVYDKRRRWPKYVTFGIFCVVCLLLMFVFVGVYVQWYVVAVMTPVCADPRCPEFLGNNACESHCEELFATNKTFLFMKQITSCKSYCDTELFDPSYYRCDDPLVGCFLTERGILGTARWFYVLVQGIVLGLTLDIVFLAIFEAIAKAFNRWENYQTDQENEKRCIEKVFLFNWVGYFYWFFLLAFLYVPNGAHVQQFIREKIDKNWVFSLNNNLRFSRYWVDGLISMDSAFVTPMIVTQALNLVIITFVPYLLRRAIIRARDSYHIKKDKISTVLKKTKNRSPGKLFSKDQGFTELSMEDEGSATSPTDYNAMLNDVDSWINLTEQVGRSELAQLLVQREPIAAQDLETALRSLFGSISSHDNHMNEICNGLSRDDLDVYQLSSYEWIDRVTRSIEERLGNLKGIWDAHGGSGGDKGSSAKHLKIRLITQWQCRNYEYTADRILEESSMPVYSPFGDLLHLAIQFSYTIMFSVVWPFCCFCAFCRNTIALRFDAIRMTIDCKRPVPRRTVGIGPWSGAFLFEILIALMVVPALFVYVSGQLDAFFDECEIDQGRYGPSENCVSESTRMIAFCSLENIGIALCFLVYIKKNDISDETTIKIVEHSRKLRHSLRKSVRMIGESVLVQTIAPMRKIETERQKRQQDLLTLETDPSAMFAVDLNDGTGSPLRRRRVGSGPRGSGSAPNDGAITSAQALLTMEDNASEWREGTVSWVRNGRIKVNFSGGRQLSGGGIPPSTLAYKENEVWLNNNEKYVLMDPTPVKIFEIGAPVLLASKKFGRWLEATITGLDNRDRSGRELTYTPNEMHFRFVEAQNLKTHAIRHAAMIDPYCVLTVGSSFRHTTTVKRRAINPLWDERIVFPLSERELYEGPGGASSTSIMGTPSAPASRTNSSTMERVATSTTLLDKTNGLRTASRTGTLASLAGAVANGSSNTGNSSSGGGGGGGVSGLLGSLTSSSPSPPPGAGISNVPVRTLKLSVINNDPFAMGESMGDVEIDLNQFRNGQKHRLLIPLSQKRHVWTLEAIQSIMRKQVLGGNEYAMLGMPHILIELQWIDTRLPTRVAVRVKGQAQSELRTARCAVLPIMAMAQKNDKARQASDKGFFRSIYASIGSSSRSLVERNKDAEDQAPESGKGRFIKHHSFSGHLNFNQRSDDGKPDSNGAHSSLLSKRPSLIIPFSGNQTNAESESSGYLEDFQAPIAKSGVLIKQANHLKTWKKRLMVLKGHSLFYYVSGTSGDDTYPRGVIPLLGVRVTPVDPARFKRQNCFELCHAGYRPIYLMAKSEADLNVWMSSITSAAMMVAADKKTLLVSESLDELFETPALEDAPPYKRPYYFRKKMAFCLPRNEDTKMSTTDLFELNEKRLTTLCDLNNYCDAFPMILADPQLYVELLHLVSSYLFRPFPIVTSTSPNNIFVDESAADEGGLGENPLDKYSEYTTEEQNWGILSSCYDLLLKAIEYIDKVEKQTRKEFYSLRFVAQLVTLFKTPSFKERQVLKGVLHRLYYKLTQRRSAIRKEIAHSFYEYIYEGANHYGVSELLEILGSIVNGFACPIKQEHVVLLERALIPLHSTPAFISYHQQLAYCMIQYVSKDHSLFTPIVRGLLKYWPVGNSFKEVIFVVELEELMEHVLAESDFDHISAKLARRLGRCMTSDQFQVAERAIACWTSPSCLRVMNEYEKLAQSMFDIIKPYLRSAMHNHWNTIIQQRAQDTYTVYYNMGYDAEGPPSPSSAQSDQSPKSAGDEAEMSPDAAVPSTVDVEASTPAPEPAAENASDATADPAPSSVDTEKDNEDDTTAKAAAENALEASGAETTATSSTSSSCSDGGIMSDPLEEAAPVAVS
ncbi:TPA: hypothetical protein N0F65_010398 [Lagenidium giganteum]|uniref:Uncharacterized protein n=1 Tax=Lagenidium giganteum TaxID=4803 RepID=A0AAV2YV62_9STRA|nr:TPA: hypothetical protein N0F65_010398 [Lagenidium giganteum]